LPEGRSIKGHLDMNIRLRLDPEETRARILVVAEEHFRRMGYAKTAIADLAEKLGMSSANIYRFFASKSAINDEICRRMLAGGQALAQEISSGPGSASDRLKRLIVELHHYNKSRMTDEHRIHDMVEAAMQQSWPAVESHCDQIKHILGGIVREGIASGEFGAIDPDQAAEAVFASCCCLFHPTMIAQSAHKGQPQQPSLLADFLLRALTYDAASTRNPQS
jgi:AcrR family transcriptional regulator